MPSLYKTSVVKIPEAHIRPLAIGILKTYAPIYKKRRKGCIQAAINEMFESGKVIKQSMQAGAWIEMLSQQFWWHQTALLPKSGSSSNNALGADMLSIE